MTGQVIALDDHRPHTVAHVFCRACGVDVVSVHPVCADPNRLQCRCGAQDSEIHRTVPGECAVCDEVRRGPHDRIA